VGCPFPLLTIAAQLTHVPARHGLGISVLVSIAALLGWFLAAVLPADTIDNMLRDRPRWVRELIGGCWSVLIAGLGYFLIFPSWVTCLLLAVIAQLVYLAAAPLIDRWASALHKGN
jgi:hypothetical protein